MSQVLSRDLVLQAVAHTAPTRLPWTLYVAGPLEEKLCEQWGPRQAWPVPPDDLIRILWEVEVYDATEEGFRDRFGCKWKRDTGGYVFVYPPLTEPDASRIPRIKLFPDEDRQRILDARAKRPDAFMFYQFTGTLGERLWSLRGLEQTLVDYLTAPTFVHEALDVLMEMHFQALDEILDLPVDGVTFGDDFGTQNGLMISRALFLKFFKPRLAKLYERVRGADKIVGHHSCGDNTELFGDLIDIGLQVFHPLQPESMDIARIKREFGRDLTFRGGIGTQRAIVFGTPKEARMEVRKAVQILADGGGYLLETAKPLPEGTPVANAIAVIEEMARLRTQIYKSE